MYQRDYDNVKSKLKGLWTQYSTGSAPNTRDPTTQADLVEEMLLFPTYAYRDERLKVWRVQVRGWAFCRNPNTRRVRLAASLMRRFIRIPPGGEPDQLLLDRVSYLFAGQPASSDMVKVAMAGIAEPMPFELHTKQSHLHPPPLGEKQSSSSSSSSSPPRPPSSFRPVNLLDAPIVLTTHFDPSGTIAPDTYTKTEPPCDRVVRNSFNGVEPTIIQKALQIDAFSWQNLVLDEGLFQGEILLGFNELEWLVQSYEASHQQNKGRRLVELRGKLFGWPQDQIVGGLAHLVEPLGVSVVSDIDDTIKASNITAEKRIVLETVFARPMQAVPGMSSLYRDWYERGCEFHYVSNSPWQLYPSLDDFFHSHRFPPGSAHLRSFDPNDLLSIKNYTGTPQLKSDTIETLFQMFPLRRWIFVGDCGEHDLETYTELARKYPDRVLRIYIRDVFAPMSVAAVTTDMAVAGTSVAQGIIPYGIVRPTAKPRQQAESDYDADLINLSDYESDNSPPPIAKQAPPVPPKPLHLRSNATPPPKPPRRINTNVTMPGSFTPSNVPLEPPPPAERVNTADRFEARIMQLREHAQEWLAFYAQQFYVAPTQSFLRYAHIFMPTVEQNMHIIDYEAVAAEQSCEGGAPPISRQASEIPSGHRESSNGLPHTVSAPTLVIDQAEGNGGHGHGHGHGHGRVPSFAAYNIPEPPPPEAQLARTSRRLQLWKRYQLATQGLAPDLCRLFVDASDIKQDHTLHDTLLPQQ